MNESEKILVIRQNSSNKLKIKGSQFIGYAYKISKPNDAIKYLEQIRSKYYDASHHCYAYLTKDGNEKYSDDGEPNGSAGIRILNAINHFNVKDIIIIVVRYFGGTKLGIGPLGKAYGDTALNLLDNSSIIVLTKFEKIKIKYPYSETSSIHYLLNKYHCQKIESIFESQPQINCLIEPHLINKMDTELVNKTSGIVQLERIKSVFYLRLKQN